MHLRGKVAFDASEFTADEVRESINGIAPKEDFSGSPTRAYRDPNASKKWNAEP